MQIIKFIIYFIKSLNKERRLYKIDKEYCNSEKNYPFEINESYFLINERGDLTTKEYMNDYYDRYCKIINNQFLSRKMAKKQLKRINLINELEMKNQC